MRVCLRYGFNAAWAGSIGVVAQLAVLAGWVKWPFGGGCTVTIILNLATGFDFCKPKRQKHVLNYIERHKPLVIFLASPCISFGHWARFNRVLHPATWQESRRVGEILAAFAARILRLQFVAGRYFLLQNPAGSGTIGLESFKRIRESGKVVAINLPQCSSGFVADGQPIYKTKHSVFPLPFC